MTEARPNRARSRVAILIPVYNDQNGLTRSLGSLRADGGTFDVVVVDDGSTPEASVSSGLPFHTRLIRLSRNRGIVGALNAGLEHVASADYEYVARLDAGDLSLPGRIGAQTAFLDANLGHAVVGCWARHVDEAGRGMFEFRPPAEHQKLMRFLRYRVGLVHTSVMLRFAALKEAGYYEARFAGAEDLELYLRLARQHKLANLERAFVVREITANSITSRRKAIVAKRLRVLWHHFDARSLHAYLGITSNLAFFFLPRALVLGLREWRGQLRRE